MAPPAPAALVGLTEGTLGYIFAIFFLFMTLVFYTLYSSNTFAWLLTHILVRFVIPDKAFLRIGSIGFAPLRCRLMIKDVHYFNQDIGLKITDAYVTLKYWGRLVIEEGWRKPLEREVLRTGQKVRCVHPVNGRTARGTVAENSAQGGLVKVSFPSDDTTVHTVPRKSLSVEDYTGRLQVHINGLEFTAYNSVAKYEALRKMAAGETSAAVVEEVIETMTKTPRQHSTFEKVMSFIRRVDIDVRSGTVSLGCLLPSVPYFMHLSFTHLIGSYFVTSGEFITDDLYRHVLDLTFRKVGLQWVPTDKIVAAEVASVSKCDGAGAGRLASIRRNFLATANLMLVGDSAEGDKTTTFEVADAFTTILDRRENPAMHIVYYWDQPGVETVDMVVRPAADLAKSGIEVEVDAKKICYGPFSGLCLKMIGSHFSPPDYKPWPLYEAHKGAPRPVGVFEVCVDFVCDVVVVVPFKHKTISPQLPYGIEDSGNTGSMTIHIGKGSRYVGCSPLIMHKCDKTIFSETHICIEQIKVFTSMNNSCMLMAERLDVFMDYVYGQNVDDRSVGDTILNFKNADVWYLSDHGTFLGDVGADFSYAKTMYFGDPIERYWKDTYHFSEFVPSDSTTEIFFENSRVHLNANPHNVTYATDHCNNAQSNFVTLAFKTGSIRLANFCPFDQYCIFRENEFKNEFNISFEDVAFHLNLPATHTAEKDEHPFLRADTFRVGGYNSSMAPNMSLPMELQDKSLQQTNSTVGLGVHYNTCLIVMELSTVHARLRMHHAMALSSVYNNYFTEEAAFATPEEFARFQNNGKNIKYGLVTYLCRNDFRLNDLDLTLEVTFKNLSIDLDLGSESDIRGTVRIVDLTYVMHFSSVISEGHVVCSPIVLTFSSTQEGEGKFHQGENSDFLVIQGFEFWKNGFYGPSPLYLLYHVNGRIVIQSISGSFETTTLAFLAEFGVDFMKTSTDTRLDELLAANPPIRPEILVQGKASEKAFTQFRKPHEVKEESVETPGYINPYTDSATVSQFLEAYSKKADAVDEAARMQYNLIQGSVREVRITLACDVHHVCSFTMPQGAHGALSTLHDGNTDSRWTVSIPEIETRLLLSRANEMLDEGGDFIEVGSLQCAVCVRRTICYGAGEGYVNDQYSKQRMFIATMRILVDYDGIGETATPSMDTARRKKSAFGKESPTRETSGGRVKPPAMSVDVFTVDGTDRERDDAVSPTSFASCDYSKRDVPGDTLDGSVLASSGVASEDDREQTSEDKFRDSSTGPISPTHDVGTGPTLRLLSEYHNYLRSFDRVVEGSNVNVLTYARAAGHSTRRLGSLSAVPKIMYIRHMLNKCTTQYPRPSMETTLNDDISWTKVFIDNERRSREKTSTYHWHIECTKMVYVVLTPKAVKVALRFAVGYDRAKVILKSLPRAPQAQASPAPTNGSKVQTKMEWLYNYTTIFSFAAPEIQLRIINSMRHTKAMESSKVPAFQTVLSFQRINAVHSNEEPARVQGNPKAKQVSASLSVEAVHLVVQCLTSPHNCMPDLSRAVLDSLEGIMLHHAATAFILSIKDIRVRRKQYRDMSDAGSGDRMPCAVNIKSLHTFLCRDSPEMLVSLLKVLTAMRHLVTLYLSHEQVPQPNPAPPPLGPQAPQIPHWQRVRAHAEAGAAKTSQRPKNIAQPPSVSPSITSMGFECTFVLGEARVKYFPTSFFEHMPSYDVHSSSSLCIQGITVNCSTRPDVTNLSLVVDISKIYVQVFPSFIDAFHFEVAKKQADSVGKPTKPTYSGMNIYSQVTIRCCDLNVAATRFNYVQLLLTKTVASYLLSPSNKEPSQGFFQPVSSNHATFGGGTFTRQRSNNMMVEDSENARAETTICVETFGLKYAADLTFLRDHLSDLSSRGRSCHPEDISLTDDTVVLQCTIRAVAVSLNADSQSKNRGSLHLAWTSFLLEMPHRPNASETVVPQYKALVQSWQKVVKSLSSEQAAVEPAATAGSPFGLISLELAKVEVRATLVLGAEIDFCIPRICVVNVSQDDVTRIRFHTNGPQLVSAGRTVHFPDVFVFATQFKSTNHTQCVAIIEKLETEITSEMFVNAIAMYQKLSNDLVEYITSLKSDDTNDPVPPTPTRSSSFDTTVYFAGANVTVLSLQSDVRIEISNLKVWISSNDNRDQRLKWYASLPRLEVMLCDSERESPVVEPKSPKSRTERRGSGTLDLGEEPKTPDKIASPSGQYPGANPFIWAHVVTSGSASNFSDTAGGVPDVAHDASNFGEQAEVRGTTEVFTENEDSTEEVKVSLVKRATHVQVDVPTLRFMLRSGGVETVQRLVDEYRAEWVILQSEVTHQTKELKARLKKSSFYNNIVRNQTARFQKMTSVTSPLSNVEDEFRWVTITSVLVRNVSVVAPAGDNLYNRAVNKALVFDCKHDGPHTHTLSCLDKRYLVPAYAIKLTIDEISFSNSKEQIVDHENGPCESKVFSLRLLKMGMYVHEGHRVETRATMFANLQQRKVMGGVGYFGEASPSEFAKSRNSFMFPSVIVKAKILTAETTQTTNIHGHIEAPQCKVNPRAALYFSDFAADYARAESHAPSSGGGASSPTKGSPYVAPNRQTTVTYCIEMTSGEVALHPWAPLPSGFSNVRENAPGGFQRRVSFSHPAKNVKMRQTAQESERPGVSDSSCVLTIPTPSLGVCAMLTSEGGTSVTCVNVDIVIAPIDIHPTSIILWQEYLLLAAAWNSDKIERAASLLQSMQDVLPIPRALLTSAVAWAAQTSFRHTRQVSATLSDHRNSTSPIKSHVLLHVCVAPFRISATCSPISATSVSLSIEEQGGVNIIMSSKTSLTSQTSSLVIGIRKVRVEVQTRMEVKFLELSIPEAHLDIVPGPEITMVLCTVPDAKKDAFELVVRLTHASQMYMIMELWRQKGVEATASLAQYNRATSHVPVEGKVTPNTAAFACSVEIDRLVTKIELGPSNKHEITMTRVIATLGTTPKGAVVERRRGKYVYADHAISILDVHCSEIAVRCDGQATGTVTFPGGFVFRSSHTGSPEEGGHPTQQMYLAVPHVRAALRERQVKDVINVEIHALHLRVYDENIAGSVPQHHVFVDVSTERTSLAASTEFVNVASNVVSETTTTIANERQLAQAKLDGHKFYSGAHSRKTDMSIMPLQGYLLGTIPHIGTAMQLIPTGQVRLLFGDIALTLGDLSHTAGIDAAALQLTVQSIAIEYAQCYDRGTVRKVLQLSLHSWDIFRKTSDKRSAIIGAKGTNTFDLSASQPLGHREVTYTFAFQCERPWHGSPHMVDFEVINKTVNAFARSAATPEDGDSPAPTSPPLPDERMYRAKRSTGFAPELRVVSDAVINIDTVLGWLGMQEDAIPRLLYVNVADGLEGLLHSAYVATCPEQILEADKAAVMDILVAEKTPSNMSTSASNATSMSPVVTPSGTPAATPSRKLDP